MEQLWRIATAAAAAAMVAMPAPIPDAALAAETPSDAPVIRHQDVPLYSVYAWERWGNFINAQAGSKTEIPYDAAHLQVKIYTFPTGAIRAIRFAHGVRTHRHINLTDTVLYSWRTRRVHFVNDLATVVGPGDFALHQKGVYHSGEEIRRGGGIDLEFAVNIAGIHNDPTGYWSFARNHPVQQAASWLEKGRYMEAIGEAASDAPPGAARYRVRLAPLPGFPSREIYLPKGVVIPSRDPKEDRLMFVLSGKLKITTCGQDYMLLEEDAARAERGKDFKIEALEDSMIAQASVPPAPAK